MLQPTDVNDALIRQAVDELEIGVPIRSWEVANGELVLHLAYSVEPARWSPAKKPGFAQEPGFIPDGNLHRLKKKELQEIARARNVPQYQNLLKGELVELLEALRGSAH